MRDPDNGRRNCGEKGLDKIVIEQQQSLRIEQTLTEAQKNHLIIWSHCSSRRPVNTHMMLLLTGKSRFLRTLSPHGFGKNMPGMFLCKNQHNFLENYFKLDLNYFQVFLT